MKWPTIALMMSVALTAAPAWAGVVMEMNAIDGSGNETEENTIYAEGEQIRLDNLGGAGEQVSMIFRGDHLVMLNHDEKEYYLIDEETLEHLNSQMSEAMRMMEEQLANVPPEQRAMVEKMMQGKMQEMGMTSDGAASAPPAPRVEKSGSENWQGYPCVKYSVIEGELKSQEVLATPMTRIEGAEEMKESFKALAVFLQKMTESFKAGPFAQAGQTPLELLEEIDGFPVVTRYFEDGEITREVFLESSSTRSLESSLFEVPKGYKKRDIAGQRR
jgi:hypothetical protein